jgi:MFS family permease
VTAQWPMTAVPTLGFRAISVPTGVADGLPVGVQLLGRRFREDTVSTRRKRRHTIPRGDRANHWLVPLRQPERRIAPSFGCSIPCPTREGGNEKVSETGLVVEAHSRLQASVPRGARFAVATAFFVNGAVQANWVTRIPAVQEELNLSAGALGAALLGLPVGLVAIVSVTGWLVARFGSRLVTRSSAPLYCLTLILLALAPNLPLLFLALVAFGAGAGALDVAMNTHGVAVERRYGRPILSSFHGLFSVGGLVGAAAGGAVVSLGIGTTQHLLGTGLFLGIVALAASRWLLPSNADAARTAPTFALPSWSLVGLGVVAFCALLGEGAMADWSAVYLQGEIGTGPGLAAAGFAAFSLTMAAGRLTGDRINQRLGPTTLTQLGGTVAATGLLAALVTDRSVVAILGFACVGVGFSTIFPLVVSTAGSDASMSSGPALAAVTTVGYFGLLAGPPLIGFAAEFVTLRGSLGIVMVLSVIIALLAGNVRCLEEKTGPRHGRQEG